MALAPRIASADDAAAVAELVHAAYRSDESRTGWTTEADLIGGQRVDAAMVRELVAARDGVVLVAEGEDGGLLTCCHLERRGDTAHLGMFAVRPGLQGRGTGRAMLAAVELHAREVWGAATLALTVINHRRELIAWYERCGFEMTGVEHAFPYGDERYGLPRRDDLVLLGMSKPLAAATG